MFCNLIGSSRIQPYERYFQSLDLMGLSVTQDRCQQMTSVQNPLLSGLRLLITKLRQPKAKVLVWVTFSFFEVCLPKCHCGKPMLKVDSTLSVLISILSKAILVLNKDLTQSNMLDIDILYFKVLSCPK